MPRRTPQETRELMLRSAAEIIRERALESGDEVLSSVLAGVRLTDVAKRASAIVRAETGDQKAKAITTGAIYQQWPTQGDFQVDLLFHITGQQAAVFPDLPGDTALFRGASAAGVPLATVFMQMMEEVQRHFREDPMSRVELGFLMGVCDPRLQAALAQRQDIFYAAVGQAYEALLDAYHMRIRSPFTIRDLSRTIAAQIVGSTVIWFADPALLDDPMSEDGCSLMSRSILAVLESLIEPIPDDTTHPTTAPE